MSKLSRLIGMASKALGDKNPSTGASSHGASASGSTDWRQMVRSAADAITGDGRDGARSDGARHPSSYAAPHSAPQSAPHAAPPAYNAGSAGLTPPHAGSPRRGASANSSMTDADRAAIARYDYLVQTADPSRLEQIHREAFERLTPEQRAQVEARLNESLPPHERPQGRDAGSLARAATRSEMMRPGSLRSLLGRVGGAGGGRGGRAGATALAVGGVAAAGGLLAAVAGGAIVSSMAGPLLAQAGELGVDFDALADGIDPEALAGGFGDVAGGFGEQVGDQVSGLGDQVSGFGEQLSNFELPGLGDFFGR